LNKRFVIQGVNPATGGIAVLTLLARSELDAKDQAEGAGLRFVVVRPDAPQPEGEAESSEADVPPESDTPTLL
jgi:hypothetical protein